MAFERIQWTYNPPPTLAPTGPTAVEVSPGAGVTAVQPPVDPRNSRAYHLLSRLSQLTEAARYLEQAILTLAANRGVVLDLGTDPALKMALERIYGISAPAGISVGMYNALLDAEIGALRTDIAIAATGGTYQVDPVQRGDVQTVNQAFEKASTDDGSYDSHLPLVLRSLKSDRALFDHMALGLKRYPVLEQASTAASGSDTPGTDPALGRGPVNQPDVDPDTTDNLNERLDAWSQHYQDTYSMLTVPSPVYGGLNQIGPSLSTQLVSDLQAILNVLRALEMLFYKPSLATLLQEIAMLSWTRLGAELSIFNSILDIAYQKATAPVQSILAQFGKVFYQIQYQANEVAHLVTDGARVRNAIAPNAKPLSKDTLAKINAAPKELARLAGYISWGMQQTQKQRMRVEVNMMKVLDLKLTALNKHQQTLNALKDAEAIIQVVIAFIQTISAQAGSLMGMIVQAETATGQIETGAIQILEQNQANKLANLPPPPPLLLQKG